jgi:hypothetical protein
MLVKLNFNTKMMELLYNMHAQGRAGQAYNQLISSFISKGGCVL